MGTPTRFNYGVTNCSKSETLGMYLSMDPTRVHAYFNDFDTYTAADWTVTSAGTISAVALIDSDGGKITLTTDAGANDKVFLDKVGESFLFVAGRKTWFKTRFALSDATDSKVVCGLQITDSSPLSVSDGVFFSKADNTAAVTLEVVKNGTATSSAVATMTDATNIELGFYYNGVDGIAYFVNDVQVGTSAVTNLPDDEVLTVSFGFQNGAAASKTMTVDYIFAAKERR